MRQQRDEAYVLQTHALGESDLILSLFTAQHGKLRGVARGARRSRRRFGGALEPLTRVRVTWSERSGSELQRIESLEALRSYAAMQSDPLLQAACAVLCELCGAFAHENQADPTGFRLLGAALDALGQGADVWGVLRYYEFWMLQIHGLLPDLDVCARCGAAAADRRGMRVVAGVGVVCPRCPGEAGERRWPFGRAERAFLGQARRRPPAELNVEAGVAGSGTALEALLRGTLESFAERRFRSYRHLGGAPSARAVEDASC